MDMTTSIRSARTDSVASAAPQSARAATAVAGRWLPIAWGVLVILCLAFWVGVAGLLVVIS